MDAQFLVINQDNIKDFKDKVKYLFKKYFIKIENRTMTIVHQTLDELRIL